ncbi:MAG: XAC2610-related protein [Candidatus Promineifilaceae bacterium]
MKGMFSILIGILLLLGCQSILPQTAQGPSSANATEPPLIVVRPNELEPLVPQQTIPLPTRNSSGINITVVAPTEPPPPLETTRVVFAPGASSARLAGELAAQGQARYTLSAMEGQEIRLALVPPVEGMHLTLETAAGNPLLNMWGNSAEWRGILPSSGDYVVGVTAPNTAANYAIEVQIMPLGDVAATETLTITRRHMPLGNLQILLDGAARNPDEFNVKRMTASVQGKQVLMASRLDTFSYVQNPEMGLRLVDVNFDGFDDLLLQEFLPASPSIPYLYYLYNPALGQFLLDDAYRHIPAPLVNATTQTLTAYERFGAAGGKITTYRIVNNKPVAIREETDLYLTDRYVYTVNDPEQGNMLLISKAGMGPDTIPADCPLLTRDRSLVVNTIDNYCFLHAAPFKASRDTLSGSILLTGPNRNSQGRDLAASLKIVNGGSANGRPLEQVIADEVAARTSSADIERLTLSYEELTLAGQFAVGVTGLPTDREESQVVIMLVNDTIFSLTSSPIDNNVTNADMTLLWESVRTSLRFLP